VSEETLLLLQNFSPERREEKRREREKRKKKLSLESQKKKIYSWEERREAKKIKKGPRDLHPFSQHSSLKKKGKVTRESITERIIWLNSPRKK
jgi:hypothetical protein